VIGKTLGHYRILARLGAGGMGEVYTAEDTVLKRRVALKVLPSEMAADPVRRERFQREAEAVATLDHPNIVTIHSIEKATLAGEPPETVHFFTMQLVQGETLSELIPRNGYPVDEFVGLAIPLAAALGAAHRAGIIHRDLKPGNLMVGEDGRLRVLDFGIAKLRADGPVGETTDETKTAHSEPPLTGEGTVVGTAPYMSPEQIKGVAVDSRSDIFSLGSIFYEMTVGRRSFSGDTWAEVMAQVLRDTPPSVCLQKQTFPPRVDEIIGRCLAKNPGERYQSVDDLQRDLKSLRDEITMAGSGGSPVTTSPCPIPDRPSLAVLPFVNLSGDPDEDYFAAGLWTDINSDLVKLSGLFLISMMTTGSYTGKSVSVHEVGRELGVRYVLEGTVRRAGDRIRITAQLTDTRSGEPVWAERYDRTLEDLFALQDEINDEIVTALDVKLIHGEGQRIMRQSLKCPQAREIYYRALGSLFTSKREDLVEARRLLSQVSELEPDSPLSYVFASFGHYFEAGLASGETAESSLQAAMDQADKALERDDPTGSALMVKGIIHLMRKEHERALELSGQALEQRPSCPWAYALKGAVYNYRGEPAKAIELARVAIRYTPLVPPLFPALLATGHYLCGQHDEAVDAARRTIELAPENLEAHLILVAGLVAAGREVDSRAAVEQVRLITPDFVLEQFAASQPYEDPAILERMMDDLRTAGLS